jgi:O-antigen/teichoic acid export membrane protein
VLLIPTEIRSWNGTTKAISGIWAADSLRGRFARGAVWSLIGAVIAQGANLTASVITARLLGREQFGEYGIIQSTVGMLGVFAGFGLGITATKYVAELRTLDPGRAGRIIALGCAVAIISGGLLALGLFVYAPVLAAKTLNAPALADELRIASVLLFFNALSGAQTGALSGFEAFRAIARINMARGLLTFPVTVALVLLWRLPGAIWALAATAALTCILSQIALRRLCAASGIHSRFSSAWKEWRVLWSFSTPAFLAGALTGPVTWAANTMLVNQPGGYAEMGVLSAASQWRTALLFLPGLVGQVALPMLSSLQNIGGKGAVRRVLLGSVLTNALCTAPLLVILLPCSRWIMPLYGTAFSGRGAVLEVSLLSAALLAIQTPVGNFIAAFGRMWVGFFMNAGWAVCLLTIAKVLLGLGWGAQAIACAYLGAYLAHALWTFWFAATVLRRFQGSSASALAGIVARESPSV